MIVVSGCPRSGTSMMMKIMLEAFGDDRIIGEAYPQKKRSERQEQNQKKLEAMIANGIKEGKLPPGATREDLRDAMEAEKLRKNPKLAYKKYVRDFKQMKREARLAGMNKKTFQEEIEARMKARREVETVDMNPNGFYECEYTVRGIFYQGRKAQDLKEIKEKKKDAIVKIVSQGLSRSDPSFVDKIIFMVRNPAAVAKSQERLGSVFNDGGKQNPIRGGEEVKMNSVGMFNTVSIGVSKWIAENPEIPLHVVVYDNLLDNPETELEKLFDFLGEGDREKASTVIDPNLRRSEPVRGQGWDWDLAYAIYEEMKAGRWQNVSNVVREAKKTEPLKRVDCARLGMIVSVNECLSCLSLPETMSNHRKYAEERMTEWKNLPCAYECLALGKTPEESVKNNNWLKGYVEPVRCAFAEVLNVLAVPARPCQGRKVLCSNPKIKLDSIVEKNCNKDRCKFFTTERTTDEE